MERDWILKVENLQTRFAVGKQTVNAVNDVSFSLRRGSILGLVGESGCGKSVTAHSILQLLPKAGSIAGGKISYRPKQEREIVLSSLKRNGKEMRALRGKDIAMIFQDPLSSLDPVYPIGWQIMENLKTHEKLPPEEAKRRVIDMLSELGIPSPEKRYKSYPHEFSGGMKQRVMIAIGMICNPGILIADEPTTALDVTIQAQILNLMKKTQKAYGTSIILITHNMGIVAEVCDEVAVMYMGRIVEFGTLQDIFNHPAHPYTQLLLKAVPVLGMGKKGELEAIPGNTPDASVVFQGCEFQPRCPNACERCTRAHPPVYVLEHGHEVRCWQYERGEGDAGAGNEYEENREGRPFED